MSQAPTLLIMAGGTGGHIMPGLAVADVLRARGWTVCWLGNPEKMEGRLVPERGYRLLPLKFQGLRGKGARALLSLPLRLAMACNAARKHFKAVRPDVVLGMGGYVAFPGGVVSKLQGVPLIVHEQNAIAGTANKALAKFARAALSGFPNVLPGGQHVGNPVRHDVCALPDPALRYDARTGPLNILVVGGSLGAQVLNVVVPQALTLLDAATRPRVVHQSGEQHIDALRQAYAEQGVDAECVPFVQDMAGAIGAADLVICRAGAMTVAEVAAAGVAALFIPLPHAIDDHQNANARYLSDARAAWRQPQNEFNAPWLANRLATIDREQLKAMAQRARAFAQPEAAERIADICASMARPQS